MPLPSPGPGSRPLFACRPLVSGLLVNGLLGLFALALWGSLSVARAADPPTTPFLRIETGMHGAAINALALAADGRLVSVSDDKTARLWSLDRAAALPAILRPPIGEEDEGALYAVAAGGGHVAVAGRTGVAWDNQTSVYLFKEQGKDGANPVMIGRIPGLPAPVSALAFSADGTYLAVGLYGKGGLRVFDMKAQKPALSDTAFAAAITGLDFAPDGSLAVAAADRSLRLYPADFKTPPRTNSLEAAPWRLRFSPDGGLLAVGSAEAPQVALFDGRTLDRRATLTGGRGRTDGLSVVAWTPRGALLAAGRYADGDTWYLRQWATPTKAGADGSDQPLARRTVTDLLALPDGRVAYVTTEPRWGVLGAAQGREPLGREAIGHGPDTLDFRAGYQDWLKISADGSVVDMALDRAIGSTVRFSLGKRRLEAPAKPATADLRLSGPRLKVGALTVAGIDGGTKPMVGGKPVALEQNERARSAAVAPDGAAAALGSDFYLRWVGSDGHVRWRRITGAPVWGTAVSGDGRVVVAALGDGSLRWYATRNGRELLALFVPADARRWVAWTPDGYFDHSPPDAQGGASGDSLIGYHVNRAKNKEGELVRVEQMYRTFARRDLLMAHFRDQGEVAAAPQPPPQPGQPPAQPPATTASPSTSGGPVASGVSTAAKDGGKVSALLENLLARGLPPKVDVTELCEGAGTTRGICATPSVLRGSATTTRDVGGDATTVKIPEITLTVKLQDRGGGLGRAVVMRNGLVIDTGPAVLSTAGDSRVETHTIALEPGTNTIEISAFTAGSEVEARAEDRSTLRVKYNPPVAGGSGAGGDNRPVLYALAIGISDYALPALKLQNAAADAKGIIDTMLTGRLESYDKLVTYTLLDKDATRENIQAHLDLIARAARPEDAFLLFLAGHGEAVDGRYYFAPVEIGTGSVTLPAAAASMSAEQREREAKNTFFRTQGLAQDDLSARLSRIKAGRGLLILDTCYSATLQIADANATMSDQFSRAVGRPILAAAVEGALDGGQSTTVGHGLFTSYVLAGLKGKADLNRNGKVDIIELASYVMDGVETEAKRMDAIQEPTFTGISVRKFDVSAVK